MPQNIDGKEYGIPELEEIRRQELENLRADSCNLDAMCELVCADAMLCEEYPQNMGSHRLNAELCKEIALYIPDILESSEKAIMAENVCQKAAYNLFDHPRLKLRLLLLQRDAVIEQGGERAEDAESGIDDLGSEIMRLQLNIIAADQERWDDITDTGHLRRDPVEWTAEYEDAISEAQAKADKELHTVPRGMGFCFAYWSTLQRILREDYNIEWRTPSQMNPHVIFD